MSETTTPKAATRRPRNECFVDLHPHQWISRWAGRTDNCGQIARYLTRRGSSCRTPEPMHRTTKSSCESQRRWKHQVFVVEPTDAQATVEFAEELVEQSPSRLVVPILLRRARRAARTVPRSDLRRPSIAMFSGPIDSTTLVADPSGTWSGSTNSRSHYQTAHSETASASTASTSLDRKRWRITDPAKLPACRRRLGH